MHNLFAELISQLGEDPTREGLVDTPLRAAKAMQFLTRGYDLNLDEIVHEALFKSNIEEMVILKNIEFYSLCEHHLLPFFGMIHIGYLPNGKIIGVSKLARIADYFSQRLQVQENLTMQIANCVHNVTNAKGVGVIIEASHFCMMMRGVQKQNSVTTTSAFTGEFMKITTRSEFIKLFSAKLM